MRKAMCLTINRQQSLDIAFNCQGVTGGFATPGKWALLAKELVKIPGCAPFKESNIVQAKALLAEAGFPNGFKESMLVRKIAIYLKDQLSKIGIELKLDFQETADMMYYRNRFRMYQNNVRGWSLHPNEDNVMRLTLRKFFIL